LIEFFNACLQEAEGKPKITKSALLAAEERYSKYRLRSLQDEWIVEYPSLLEFTHILKRRPPIFAISDIDPGETAEFCLAYAISNCEKTDALSLAAQDFAEARTTVPDLLRMVFYAFYRAGLVALKTSTFEAFQWASEGETILSASAVEPDTRAQVHPMFHRVLGIQVRSLAGG
jgi:hypothetical protein